MVKIRRKKLYPAFLFPFSIYETLFRHLPQYQLGRAKGKSAFEHAQNVRIRIILRMRKVSLGLLLSIDLFYSIQWFWSGPSLSAHAPKAHFHFFFFCVCFFTRDATFVVSCWLPAHYALSEKRIYSNLKILLPFPARRQNQLKNLPPL